MAKLVPSLSVQAMQGALDGSAGLQSARGTSDALDGGMILQGA